MKEKIVYKKVKLHREYLKAQRDKLKVTGEDVSDKIGISYHYYAQIENGEKGCKLSVRMLLKMAQALEVDVCKLIESEKAYIESYDKANKFNFNA